MELKVRSNVFGRYEISNAVKIGAEELFLLSEHFSDEKAFSSIGWT
jgi:hypothetical protein